MIIEIDESQEGILREALASWFSNEADDTHEVNREDLSDASIELADHVGAGRVSIAEALSRAVDIRTEKSKSEREEED